MTLEELLPAMKLFHNVIITGPQRSGTTIAAKIMAKELSRPLILEESFHEQNLYRFFSVLLEHPKCVIQAPALSSMVHLLKNSEIAVVFMLRDTGSILASEKRINWLEGHDKAEKAKYFSTGSRLPVSTLKLQIWTGYQKKELGRCAFELDYESLAANPLWVNESLRQNFGPRQTEVSPHRNR